MDAEQVEGLRLALEGFAEQGRLLGKIEPIEIERVAASMSELSDFDLEVIGASSTRASEVVRAAAKKAAKARSTKYAHRDELATIEREIEQSKQWLADLEVELAAIHRDRSGDDWSREQRVNQVRAARSEFRQRLQDQDKARRAHIQAYGEWSKRRRT